MLETICKDCGVRYPLGQHHTCAKKRPAKKSTAARTDVPHEAGDGVGESLNEPAQALRDTEAGTQAPPVDPVPERESQSLKLREASQSGALLAEAEASAAHLAPKRKDKRKGDRHRPGYQAAKQREYRRRRAKAKP